MKPWPSSEPCCAPSCALKPPQYRDDAQRESLGIAIVSGRESPVRGDRSDQNPQIADGGPEREIYESHIKANA